MTGTKQAMHRSVIRVFLRHTDATSVVERVCHSRMPSDTPPMSAGVAVAFLGGTQSDIVTSIDTEPERQN